MPEDFQQIETDLLRYCFFDAANIDRAIAAGVTPSHFANPHKHKLWRFLCELHLSGKPVGYESVIPEAISRGVVGELGGIPAITEWANVEDARVGGAGPVIDALLGIHARRESYKLLHHALEEIKEGGGSLETVKAAAEKVAGLCAGNRAVQRTLRDAAAEAIRDAEGKIAGLKPVYQEVTTGLPTFDRYATPMMPHEYVVLGARTSHGKSSFLNQVAGHNLSRGLKVAIFTLETSDTSVVKQIAAQRAGVNVKKLHDEMPERQQQYLAKLRHAQQSKDLLVFDKDLTLQAIESRCRLLAQSFKPTLVIIDYLGLIGGVKGESYERMTQLSKAMIPLTKMLGCTVLMGAQFSRDVEKNPRPPARTDFKDCGSIEEDAHRLLALYRLPDQPLDADHFDTDLYQLKMRDGPLARVSTRFHAPTTVFREVAA